MISLVVCQPMARYILYVARTLNISNYGTLLQSLLPIIYSYGDCSIKLAWCGVYLPQALSSNSLGPSDS